MCEHFKSGSSEETLLTRPAPDLTESLHPPQPSLPITEGPQDLLSSSRAGLQEVNEVFSQVDKGGKSWLSLSQAHWHWHSPEKSRAGWRTLAERVFTFPWLRSLLGKMAACLWWPVGFIDQPARTPTGVQSAPFLAFYCQRRLQNIGSKMDQNMEKLLVGHIVSQSL